MKTLSLSILTVIICVSFSLHSQEKKVLMHYMVWYGDSIPEENDSLRHWDYGYAHKPLIGKYDSKSWSLTAYHVLLSYSCGIDGVVANIKDDYDEKSLSVLISTINKLREIDPVNFKYKFAISYDDQGMDNIVTAKGKLIKLRDIILPNTESYLKYNDIAVIFIWNYKDPPYLSPIDYRDALNEVFPTNRPKVIWNEIEAPEIANSYYPWVQGWDDDGSNWGKIYLEWFYNTIAVTTGLDFATGGVWAGFDDRKCSWTRNRWIDRQNGKIYDSTWRYVNNYSGNLPLNWVYIETWNDWNEGTEIEPSIECGYQYLDSTIKNINRFKLSSVSLDNTRYQAAKQIYDVGWLIEHHKRDSLEWYQTYTTSIAKFLQNDFIESLEYSNCIIKECSPCPCQNSIDILDISNSIKVYPNPTDKLLKIEISNNKINGVFYSILINTEGKEIQKTKLHKYASSYNYEINIKGLAPGIYYLIITDGKYKGQQKLIIL